MSKQQLNVSYPARRVPAGTVEFPVSINGREYFTFMAPGACVLRTFYGINQITKAGAHPSEILAAIVLTGCGGSIMIFTDAYSKGADVNALKSYVESQKTLIDGGCAMTVTPTGSGGYGGSVFTGVLNFNNQALRNWFDETFGSADEYGWGGGARVNMDAIFYQFGGRPHAARDSDATYHKQLDETFEKSRAKLGHNKLDDGLPRRSREARVRMAVKTRARP